MQTDQMPYFRKLLMEELKERKKKNQLYSLRAFARALSLDPATLSRTLNGKHIPSLKNTKIILQHLLLEQHDKEQFIDSVIQEQKRRWLE